MASMADLPDEILRAIKSKLCLSDQAKFSAVCKRWHSLLANQILAMEYFWSDRIIFHYDLYEQCGRRIRNGSITTEPGEIPYYFGDIKVWASKMGWFLIVEAEEPSGVSILCNPFLKRALILPRLGHRIDVATLSKIPTSLDCIIFFLYQSLGKTHLGRFRIADGLWSSRVVAEGEELPLARSAVYLEGELFCVFKDGMLGCYDVSAENWTVFVDRFPDRIHLDESVPVYVVASPGKILLATLDVDQNWSLLKFDLSQRASQRAWIVETSLGGKTWFAGPTSFLVSSVGIGTDLADCICYFDRDTCDCMVHSFKDPEVGWISAAFKPEELIIRLRVCNEKEDINGWRVWIEAPSV